MERRGSSEGRARGGRGERVGASSNGEGIERRRRARRGDANEEEKEGARGEMAGRSARAASAAQERTPPHTDESSRADSDSAIFLLRPPSGLWSVHEGARAAAREQRERCVRACALIAREGMGR